MKKRFCIICILLLILPLSGCGQRKNTVIFHYPRAEFQYYAQENVIVAEERDISSDSRSLEYLLPLYLVGPLDEALVSPFPVGTRLERISREGTSLVLTLSSLDGALTDPQFTLASSCLALTGFEYTRQEEITIISGQRTVTLDRSSLLLSDQSQESEEQP